MKLATLLKLLALSAAGLFLTLPAWAHTELARASPAPGAIAPPTLTEIRLTFSEPLSPESAIELLTDNFQTVPGLRLQIEGDTISAKLAEPLVVGRYTVQWKAAGNDGHVVEGSYPFSVSADAPGSPLLWPALGLGLLLATGLGAVGYRIFRRRRKEASATRFVSE